MATHATIGQVQNNCHPQWWRDPGLRSLNLRLSGLMISSMSFGFDVALIGGLLANQRWFVDLKIFDPTIIGVVIAANSMGAVLGPVPAPYLSGRFGRKWTCVVFCCMLIALTIGQAFTSTMASFVGVRVCLGVTSVSLNISSNVLISEVAHPRQRAQITSLWITFFYVGAITVAWTAYGSLSLTTSWTWRLPVIMQAAWNIVQLPLLVFLCPESPRWLALKGRTEEAKTMLAKFHANGVSTDALVELEYEEILATTNNERNQEKNSWAVLVTSKPNRHRLLLAIFLGFGSQWAGNSVVNFYFAPILNSVGIHSAKSQTAINGGLQIFSWGLAIIGALLSEKLGRRTLLLTSASGMLVSMAIVTACSALYAQSANVMAGKAVVAFLFIFFGFYCIGFTPIPPLYVAEISTPATRANLVSIYWMCTGLALCFNQFVNPIALASIGWKYYLVYVGALVAIITILFFYVPETKGKTMEEVAGIFDKDIAAVNAQVAEDVKHRHIHEGKTGESVHVEAVV